MTVAAPPPRPVVLTDDQKLVRMSTLWHWLVGVGVCDVCASTWAIGQVERETGGTKLEPWPLRCTRRNVAGRTCEEAAKSGRRSMPGRVEITETTPAPSQVKPGSHGKIRP